MYNVLLMQRVPGETFCSILKNYLQFCSQFDFPPLQDSCEMIKGLAVTTVLPVKSPQTVSHYISVTYRDLRSLFSMIDTMRSATLLCFMSHRENYQLQFTCCNNLLSF